jgi:pimeloyl-ACP methyl ester carboxylesterase
MSTMTEKKPSRVWRWIKRILLALLALVVLVIAGSAINEQLARSKARKDFPPKGRLVDIGGRKMQIDCRGQGSPTVILESGLDTNGSLAWSAVQDQIAADTRTCAYSRAGVMWSDPKKTHQNGEAVADDLHALLAAAGEKGPYVIAGHSLGGPYLMTYTRKFPEDVAGVVFVDASHPDQFKRFKTSGLPDPDLSSPVQKFLVANIWAGWAQFMPKDSGSPNVPTWAADASHAYMSTSIPAAMAEGDALTETVDGAGKLRTLGDRPLVVLTGTKPWPAKMLKTIGYTQAQADKQRALWVELHNEEASWSTRSRHEIVPDASHYIQFDRPDVVIKAVKEVVAQVRADTAAKAVAVKPAA